MSEDDMAKKRLCGHPFGQNIRTPDGKWPPNAQTCSADAVAEEFKRPPAWRDEMEAELAEKALLEQATRDDKMKAELAKKAQEYANAAAQVPHTPNLYSSFILLVTGDSGDADLERQVGEQMFTLFQLFKDRQRKYGPGNIAAFGDLGVCVRAQDKLARLRHHYFGGGAGDMPDESVDDAWRDLAVYAAIALVCREGGWPGLEKGGAK